MVVWISSGQRVSLKSFGLFADDQTTLTGLPLGVFLTIAITAQNPWGDGMAGVPGSITLN